MGNSISRRSFLRTALIGTAAMGIGGLGGLTYSSEIEPYTLDITRLRIRLPNLSPAFDGFTIAQVSDFHLGEWMTLERMLDIARQVNALAPDVIVFTGDFVSAQPDGVYGQITRSLAAFKAGQIGQNMYATLGNHDYWTDATAVRHAIEQAGNVTLLLNTYQRIQRGTETLYMAGVDDITVQRNDLDRALNGIPANAPIILLAHEPDYADEVAADGRVGLQFSGHSHGGQIRLPIKGAISLPHLGQKYDAGLYTIGTLTLYTNRGVGMIPPYVRFGCPPEVTFVTLQT